MKTIRVTFKDKYDIQSWKQNDVDFGVDRKPQDEGNGYISIAIEVVSLFYIIPQISRYLSHTQIESITKIEVV